VLYKAAQFSSEHSLAARAVQQLLRFSAAQRSRHDDILPTARVVRSLGVLR
jgi:hypothetical protein